jgi:hypothetical protein
MTLTLIIVFTHPDVILFLGLFMQRTAISLEAEYITASKRIRLDEMSLDDLHRSFRLFGVYHPLEYLPHVLVDTDQISSRLFNVFRQNELIAFLACVSFRHLSPNPGSF